MMQITDTTTLSLLLMANASLVAACTIELLRFGKQARRFEQFWESPTGVSIADTQLLQAQTDAQSDPPPADPELEKRVAELQSVVRTLVKKTQSTQQTVEPNLPIENAVRMAKHGASVDELIRNCGLNIGEAQLMRKLHGKAKSAQQGYRESA